MVRPSVSGMFTRYTQVVTLSDSTCQGRQINGKTKCWDSLEIERCDKKTRMRFSDGRIQSPNKSRASSQIKF